MHGDKCYVVVVRKYSVFSFDYYYIISKNYKVSSDYLSYCIMMIVVLVGENDCCKMCVTICCPMTKANYDIELGGAVSNRVDGMLHYTVSVESKKKSSWKDDEALLQTHSMLATIQHSIDAESRV